jgi:hypothetical protein
MRNEPCESVANRKICVIMILRENGSTFVRGIMNLKNALRANKNALFFSKGQHTR